MGQRSNKVLSALRTNARCPTELDVSWTYFPKPSSVQPQTRHKAQIARERNGDERKGYGVNPRPCMYVIWLQTFLPNFSSLKFLTPLLLLGLIGCNSSTYPSQTQAAEACDRWRLEGESISYEFISERIIYNEGNGNDPFIPLPTDKPINGADKYFDSYSETNHNRRCQNESSTNQYLGREGVFSDEDREKANQKFGDGYSRDYPEATDFKVVRHFRY